MNTNILNAIILLLKVLSEDPCKPAEVKPDKLNLNANLDAIGTLIVTNFTVIEPAAGPWCDTAKDGEPKEEGWYMIAFTHTHNPSGEVFFVDWPVVWDVPFTNIVRYYAKIRMPQ